jgi:hypothetical protein
MLHDPEYRRVRKEHLIETGRQVRLKNNLRLLTDLPNQLDGYILVLCNLRGLGTGAAKKSGKLGPGMIESKDGGCVARDPSKPPGLQTA